MINLIQLNKLDVKLIDLNNDNTSKPKFRKRLINLNKKKIENLQRKNTNQNNKINILKLTIKQHSILRRLISVSNNITKTEIPITISNQEYQKKNYLIKTTFINEIQSNFCSICQLRFYLKDKIMQCPNCNSLFHSDHIEFWLLINNICLVCYFSIN